VHVIYWVKELWWYVTGNEGVRWESQSSITKQDTVVQTELLRTLVGVCLDQTLKDGRPQTEGVSCTWGHGCCVEAGCWRLGLII
jgi:hypothetical protein